MNKERVNHGAILLILIYLWDHLNFSLAKFFMVYLGGYALGYVLEIAFYLFGYWYKQHFE